MELLTVLEAVAVANGAATESGIRRACQKGYIVGARKFGKAWAIPRDGLAYYLANRPKRGRKVTKYGL